MRENIRYRKLEATSIRGVCMRCNERPQKPYPKSKCPDGIPRYNTMCSTCEYQLYNPGYRGTEKKKTTPRSLTDEERIIRNKQYLANKKWVENNRPASILANTKSRAKKKGLEFNLVEEDIVLPEYCPVLGMKLNFNEKRTNDDSPTVDRINPNKGYIKGNIQIISYRANTLKNNGTIEEFLKIIDYIKTHS